MNSSQPPEPSDLVEELSAYLDGELDSASAQQVEELLATNTQARGELHRLERVWQALNRLSTVEVEPSFTQTTVAMIALSNAEQQNTPAAERAKRHLRNWLTVAVSLLASAVAGFLLTASLDPHENDQLLLDLPVLENVELYRQVGDIEFLRSLQQKALFGVPKRPNLNSSATSDDLGVTENPVAQNGLTERLAKVRQLNHEQKNDLLNEQERFHALPPDEQQRLRTLEATIASDPHEADLRHTLQQYHAWLNMLPIEHRIELQQLPMDQRLARVRELKAASDGYNNRKLPSSDGPVILQWVENKILEKLPPERRLALDKLPEADRRRALLREVWQRWPLNDPGRWMTQIDDKDFEELAARLSPASQQRLRTAPAKKQLLADWIRQALNPNFVPGGKDSGDFRGPGVSQDRLMRFFETELPEEEQAKIFPLPVNEFQNRLRRQYYLRHETPDHPKGPEKDGPPKTRPGERRPPKSGGDNRPGEHRTYNPERPSSPGDHTLPPDDAQP